MLTKGKHRGDFYLFSEFAVKQRTSHHLYFVTDASAQLK